MRPHAALPSQHLLGDRGVGCEAHGRGAPVAVFTMQSETMYRDVRAHDDTARIQKSLNWWPVNGCQIVNHVHLSNKSDCKPRRASQKPAISRDKTYFA